MGGEGNFWTGDLKGGSLGLQPPYAFGQIPYSLWVFVSLPLIISPALLPTDLGDSTKCKVPCKQKASLITPEFQVDLKENEIARRRVP